MVGNDGLKAMIEHGDAVSKGVLAILVIMRALGEMAVHNPVAGSFSRYAQDYLGPLAGFQETGYYGSAYRLTYLVTFPQVMLMTVMTPMFAACWSPARTSSRSTTISTKANSGSCRCKLQARWRCPTCCAP